MSNIPLKCLLGAFAVVSITGCDAIANKGFCQKTDKGYEICIKEENITCEQIEDIPGDNTRRTPYCKASGIKIDLVGVEKHWIASDPYGNDVLGCFTDSTRVICGAARHFGKF